MQSRNRRSFDAAERRKSTFYLLQLKKNKFEKRSTMKILRMITASMAILALAGTSAIGSTAAWAESDVKERPMR